MPSLSYGPGFWKNLIGVKASFGCSRNSLLYFLRFSRRILKTYRNRTMGKQIPTFEKAFGILELPEYLNGLECRRLRLMKSDKEKPILIETCRRLQDLYDEICAARFALITACQSKYPEYISSEDNGAGIYGYSLNLSIQLSYGMMPLLTYCCSQFGYILNYMKI